MDHHHKMIRGGGVGVGRSPDVRRSINVLSRAHSSKISHGSSPHQRITDRKRSQRRRRGKSESIFIKKRKPENPARNQTKRTKRTKNRKIKDASREERREMGIYSLRWWGRATVSGLEMEASTHWPGNPSIDASPKCRLAT